MTTQIVKRIDKGFPLTYQELDENFENLRTTADNTSTNVAELSAVLSSSTVTINSLNPNQLINGSVGNAPLTVKYIIQLSYLDQIQVEEILVSCNIDNTYITEYGVIVSNEHLASFSADYVSGSLNLYITPSYQPLGVSLVKQILK